MICTSKIGFFFYSRLAVFLLAIAFAIPALAQQAQPIVAQQGTLPSATRPQSSPESTSAATANAPKEGFWGRVNPIAFKKWVLDRVNPIKDRLSELDEVNAKNARDIQGVDARAQSGIRQAQSAADAANQAALAAGNQAQKAGATAQAASGRIDQLNTTVNGLDQYREISAVEVEFRGGQSILSSAARKQLDELAVNLTGHQGYVLEIEAHTPAAGSAGIQNSERLAEAVKRYLVTEHEIPVYRLHSVALGNAHGAGDDDAKPVKTSSVHIRLMENSLAAKGAASTQDVASSTGAGRQ
jgi:outer membrane protein OmpA-like peptidoglycan-associated protein